MTDLTVPDTSRRARRFAAWGISRLPDRIQLVVDGERRRADWRIVMVQVTLLAFIGLLFSLSPQPSGQVLGFQPVLLALAFYAIAIGGRCLLTWWLDPLPRFFSLSGIVVDFAVLYGLIWSFHLQYGQPPAFYLKAPTQFYAFLLIALHALSLEPLRVIFAGAIAALGWALLTVYVLQYSGMGVITHDFIVYMTSNRLLLGAEIDKITAMLAFTLILSLAIASARGQLVAAAFGQTARSELSRFFARGVADFITSADEAPRAGMAIERDAAILMADMRGFTTLAANTTPAVTLQILNAFQQRLGAAVERHNGAIDKFLGDGALVTFGCVEASDRAAADALLAACDFAALMQEWAQEQIMSGAPSVEIGCAVSAGPLLFGTVGLHDRLEFTVIGDPANRAAKLEKHNKVLGSRVITDRQTFERAIGQMLTLEPLSDHPGQLVGGLLEPVDIVVVA